MNREPRKRNTAGKQRAALVSLAFAAAGVILVMAGLPTQRAEPAALELGAATRSETEQPSIPALSPVERHSAEARALRAEDERTLGLVRGHVVDPAGAPLASVPLRAEAAADVIAVSGSDGAFELRAASGDRILAGGSWATLRSLHVAPGRVPERNVVVAAPALAIAGIVVYADGTALEGARIAVRIDVASLSGFANGWLETQAVDCEAKSGADGRFRLEGVPLLSPTDLEHGELHASRAGFRDARLALPGEPQEELRIVLERESAAAFEVRGRALRVDGSPAVGAKITFGPVRARADVEGRFALKPVGFAADTPLVATLDGWQPVWLERFGDRLAGTPRPEPVELRFEAEALAIRGRLEDADGQPLKGWRVHVATESSGGGEDPLQLVVDDAARVTRTGGDGSFEFDGLARASYVLRCASRDDRTAFESPPVTAPATGVVLRPPASGDLGELAGRVVDERGEPVVGAVVGLVRPEVNRAVSESDLLPAPRATTGGDGTFVLAGVQRGQARVAAAVRDALPSQARVDVGASSPIELRVGRLVRLTFVSRSESAGALGALDAEGRPLPLWLGGATGMRVDRLVLRPGEAVALSAPAGVRTLVVWSSGEEAGRLSVDPAAGTTLSWP